MKILILLCILFAADLRAQTWTHEMDSLAIQTERIFDLPRGISKASAKVESGYDSTATREENHYFNNGGRYSKAVTKQARAFLAAHPTYDESITLERAQRTISVGLFQCMGQLLRDLGYDKETIDPSVPEQFYYFGLYTLQNKKRWHKMTDWIAAYNAGEPHIKRGQYGNQRYVNSILKAWKHQ